MTPRKLNVLIAAFSYGGNGGMSSEHPDVRDWLLETVPKIENDERCELLRPAPRKRLLDIADTPITMTRNQAVLRAREMGADCLLMIDSDMCPDLYLGSDDAVPFWDTAFDFLYRHFDRGPVLVAAPYSGPPPHENIYCFRWENHESDCPEGGFVLQQYTRREAFSLAGIQPAAALPTGLVLFDMRVFDLTEPKEEGDKPWFYYEFPGLYQAQKDSTEDVTATRDLSLAGVQKLGYNPVFCAWSSWAGHWKPKCVGRPGPMTAEMVSEKFRRAASDNLSNERRNVWQRSKIADEIDWSQAGVELMALADPPARVKLTVPVDATSPAGASTGLCRRVIYGHEILCYEIGTPDTDLEDLRDLVDRVRGRVQPDRVVRIAEIGCWVGESTTAILAALKGRRAVVTCVDHWEGSKSDPAAEWVPTAEWVQKCPHPGGVKAIFHENMATVTKDIKGVCVDVLTADSLAAAKAFADYTFDLIYLDADHDRDAVRDNLAAWFPKLRPGGIICGHDYGGVFTGVAEAVDVFFGSKTFLVVDVGRNTVWSVDCSK